MRALLFGVVLAFSAVSAGGAQAQTDSAARVGPQRCSYDVCGLRLERGWFGRRIVRSVSGVSVPFGFVGEQLVVAVDGVPAARQEALMGRRNNIKSTIAGLVGGLAFAFALNQVTSGDILEWNEGQVIGGLLVGTAGAVVSGAQAIYADRHYSKAVWLYNRELAR
jgi:hypothetical protein